jgi:hypothetical protein
MKTFQLTFDDQTGDPLVMTISGESLEAVIAKLRNDKWETEHIDSIIPLDSNPVSLQELAGVTNSYNVLIAIRHAIKGYTAENAGCIKMSLPFAYNVDLNEEELQPHFRRVNDIKIRNDKSLPVNLSFFK